MAKTKRDTKTNNGLFSNIFFLVFAYIQMTRIEQDCSPIRSTWCLLAQYLFFCVVYCQPLFVFVSLIHNDNSVVN
jgi:hypothetical protein